MLGTSHRRSTDTAYTNTSKKFRLDEKMSSSVASLTEPSPIVALMRSSTELSSSSSGSKLDIATPVAAGTCMRTHTHTSKQASKHTSKDAVETPL